MMIDYAKVRERIHIMHVLALLGDFFIRGNAPNWYGRCPLGCCKHPRCCSYEMVKSLWNCHKCGEGGNQLDLFVRVSGMSLYDAARWLCIFYDQEVPYLGYNEQDPSHNPRADGADR